MHMDTAVEHPVPDRVKPSFVIFSHLDTLTLSPERQSVRMSKITNDGLTQSLTGCSIAEPIWQLASVGVRGLTLLKSADYRRSVTDSLPPFSYRFAPTCGMRALGLMVPWLSDVTLS